MVINLKPEIDVESKYYEWLCGFCNINQEDRSYLLLFRELYNKKFRWFVPNDDNRAVEGMELRMKFCEEEFYPYKYAIAIREQLKEAVNMLEIIVSLAFRCSDMMVDTRYSAPIDKWVWELLTNAGFDKFTDEDFYIHGGHQKIDKKLNTILNRHYDRNGFGGFFPMRNSKNDQRKIEIWYQMSEYLVKNYYVC